MKEGDDKNRKFLLYAVVRVRGCVKVRRDTEETLRMLRLRKPNNCVLLPENDSVRGMLQKTKDYVTYGPIGEKVLKKLLAKWGRIESRRLDKAWLEQQGLSLDELTRRFMNGETTLKKLGINPMFRLHPPRRGYEGVKRPYSLGGALGNRGEKIDDLLERMV